MIWVMLAIVEHNWPFEGFQVSPYSCKFKSSTVSCMVQQSWTAARYCKRLFSFTCLRVRRLLCPTAPVCTRALEGWTLLSLLKDHTCSSSSSLLKARSLTINRVSPADWVSSALARGARRQRRLCPLQVSTGLDHAQKVKAARHSGTVTTRYELSRSADSFARFVTCFTPSDAFSL